MERLGSVFQNIYNFSVRKRRLTIRKNRPARHQMNSHLADFILAEDEEDSLLIIYYAGHGMTRVKDGDLVLIGFAPVPDDSLLD